MYHNIYAGYVGKELRNMRYEARKITDRTGCEIELRSAEASDCEALLRYLKTTASETPFLICDPDEVTLTSEQEKEFIMKKEASDRELLLIALENGRHIGNCSLMSISGYRRYRHRCGIAIALYKEYCGRGIGRAMLETVLDEARKAGYEQAELEVIADNEKAISMYEDMGFVKYGTMPDNARFDDGRSFDAYWMMKKL